MSEKITKGNWKPSLRFHAVVTNIPHDRFGYSWEDKESEYNWYGGYVICESIAGEQDARLISAAPDMLSALENLLTRIEDSLTDGNCTIPYAAYVEAKKAFLKANPYWEFPNRHYIIPELYKPMPLMLVGGFPDTQHHSYYAGRKLKHQQRNPPYRHYRNTTTENCITGNLEKYL